MRPFGPFSEASEPSSGPKAWVAMTGPMTLTSICRRNCSTGISSTGPATAMPALLTRPASVSPLIATRTSRAADSTAASSVMSNISGVKLAPNSLLSRCASASLRTLPNTRNPLSRRSLALAHPIPVEAPVTTTTRMAHSPITIDQQYVMAARIGTMPRVLLHGRALPKNMHELRSHDASASHSPQTTSGANEKTDMRYRVCALEKTFRSQDFS